MGLSSWQAGDCPDMLPMIPALCATIDCETKMTMDTTRTQMRPYLLVALLALSLAAWTGVLLRFGIYLGMPAWAANYAAVRHAHSHLMYFGWGTLALMALIWAHLPGWTGRALPRGVGAQMALTAVLALASFPAFWSNGYGLTKIGGMSLPLGSLSAALNGLPWFLFMALYVRATRNLPVRPLPLQLWDWALILLFLASLGAMGVGVQAALDMESHALREASLRLFLDLFATGWFTLGVLGLFWAWVGAERLAGGQPVAVLAVLLSLTFVLGMSPAAVPESVFWIAALANLVAALFLAVHRFRLLQRKVFLPPLADFALAALGAYLIMAIVLLVPGLWRWAAGTQLRVFVLHTLLLGWTSSALLGMILATLRGPSGRMVRALSLAWMAGVGLMLVALLGLGLVGLMPVRPIVWLQAAAWCSLIPASVALVALVTSLRAPKPDAAARATT